MAPVDGGGAYCPKCAPANPEAGAEMRRKGSHASIAPAEPRKDGSNKSLVPADRSNKAATLNDGPAAPRRVSAKHRAVDGKDGLGAGTITLGAVAAVFIILGIYFATESTKINTSVNTNSHDGSATTPATPEHPRPSEQPSQEHRSALSNPSRAQETNAGPSMALAMLSMQMSPEEERAEKDWPRLFDGIKPEDTQGRIKKLEAYVARLSPDWNISPRARVALENLRKMAANPAAVRPPAPLEKPVLIGHWKMDGAGVDSAADSSGNNAAAKLVNGPQRVSGGMHFNGKDAEMEIPNSPELDHLQEGSFSVCAWFKPDDDPAEEADHVHCGYGVILKRGQHTGLAYYHGGYFTMCVWGGKGEQIVAAAGPKPPGVFYHLCGVLNRKAGETQLYVNGKLEKSAFCDPNMALKLYGEEKWRIGCGRPDGGEWAWPAKGIIRDVRIYKGVLSDSEIEAIVHETKGF